MESTPGSVRLAHVQAGGGVRTSGSLSRLAACAGAAW